MTRSPFFYFTLIVFFIISAAFSLPTARAEFSRTGPTTPEKPRISTPTVEKPSTLKPTKPGIRVPGKPTSPKMKTGYCCVNGKVVRGSQTDCSRKRGKFFADQRSAQRACDSERGYCCKNGQVKGTTRGDCKRIKGKFYLKKTEASKVCAATRGFCCNRGDVVATNKGDCDRKKGKFFLQKKAADALCAKQKGYCSINGSVSQLTKGACARKRGKFYLQKIQADQQSARQDGYCCLNGKTGRMTKGACEQKKGGFFLQKPLADRACEQAKGYCCLNGKVVASTRGRCAAGKGFFALNRQAVAKKCVQQRPPVKVQPKRSAVQPGVTHQTVPPKPGAGSVVAKPGKQGFDDPLFKPVPGKQGFDDPLFKPKSNTAPLPGGGSNAHLMNTGQTGQFSGENSMLPAATIAGAGTAVIAAPQTTSGKITGAGGNKPDISLDRPPESSINFGVSQPLQVVYIKDRMVRIGNAKNPSGLGWDLMLNNVQASFPCEDGSASGADITVTGGSSYNDLATHLSAGSMVFPSFVLQDQAAFVSAHCQQGKDVRRQAASLTLTLNKTCQSSDGSDRQFDNTVTLPLMIYCDMGPDADPANYDPNSIKYSAASDQGQTVDAPVTAGNPGQVQATNTPGSSNYQTPQGTAIDTTVADPDASVALQHTNGLYVDNELSFGSAYQSVYSSAPVEMLRSNMTVQVSCGVGRLTDADLYVIGGETYSDIHNQLSNSGNVILDNVSIMDKSRFSQFYCGEGDFYVNEDRGMRFAIEYRCDMPNGENRRVEKNVTAPFTVTCDRRQHFNAASERINFKHICPDGYHIDKSGNPQSTYSNAGWGEPMECVEN